MNDQYSPFKRGLISHTVETSGMQKPLAYAKEKLDGIALIEGQRVPGCCIYLGYNLSGRDGYAVVFHMLDDCVTLSSYEYGDLKSIVVNIEALIGCGIVSDAYILAMDIGDGESSLAQRDPHLQALMNGVLADIECELLSVDPRQSMIDESPAVKLSEYLVAESGDWIKTSTKLIDALVVTVLQGCPRYAKVETADAVNEIRKGLIKSLRKIFR